MAFKNLEQRYNEKVNDLYKAATLKYEGGKTTKGATDDPLVVRKPGQGYFGPASRILGRSIPATSVVEDVKRLTKFSISSKGIAFLAKQALLQTGNTFDQTSLINPLFVLGNAVPYIHMRRHLRPISGLIKKTDTSDDNVRKLGSLQESTFKSMKEKFETKPGTFWKDIGASSRKGPSLLKRLVATLASPISRLNAKKNIFEKEGYGNRQDSEGWGKSRPELSTVYPLVLKANATYQETHNSTDEKFIKYFTAGRVNTGEKVAPAGFSGISSGEEKDGVTSINRKDALDAERIAFKRKISYVTDNANLPSEGKKLKNVPKAYETLRGTSGNDKQTFKDPITVAISMGNGEPVKFRAFIKDLQQTATPEYKPYQYVGRTEKFISYVTVQREISFKLSVVAYSKTELVEVWRRLNYLTGLVYPYGFTRGVYQPNIARLTIGNLYYDQPGYFTGINLNFNDFGWDIDEEKIEGKYNGGVPMGAEVDMKYILIEKNTKIASSPFYRITEEDERFDKVIKGTAPSPGTPAQQPATGR